MTKLNEPLTTMTNEKTLALVRDIFRRLKDSTSHDALLAVKSHENIEKNIPNPAKYPELKYELQKEDISDLIDRGQLKKDNSLSPLNDRSTALEKLLYSLLWKNGDIGKERRIIEGILSGGDDIPPTNSIVFYQFGKCLANTGEPIIDQHTLRAFELYQAKLESNDFIDKIRRRGVYNLKDWDIAMAYKEWLNKNISSNLQNDQSMYVIDQIIFGLGKAIKLK